MPCNFFRPARVLVLSVSALGAGCALQMPQHHAVEPSPPAPVTPEAIAPAVAPSPLPAPTPPIKATKAASQDDAAAVLVAMLAYAERVRTMTPAELAPELARLGEARSPNDQMQLALALAQLRQTPDMIRAQDTLTRLLANASPEAMALHPLARLLAHRFGEQRRFEDALDKQTQQTRDTQRRLEQTTERLEALKAIERSLGSQNGASNPAPRSPVVTAPSRGRSPP